MSVYLIILNLDTISIKGVHAYDLTESAKQRRGYNTFMTRKGETSAQCSLEEQKAGLFQRTCDALLFQQLDAPDRLAFETFLPSLQSQKHTVSSVELSPDVSFWLIRLFQSLKSRTFNTVEKN